MCNTNLNEFQLEEKVVRLKVVLVKTHKIQFAIKREDIQRFKNAKTDGERFKYLLRGLWKDLVIRKVKFVKTPNKVMCISRYAMDKNGNVDHQRSSSLMQIPETIGKDEFYEQSYSNYYGFASKFGNDQKDIYFHRENYCGLDLDINCTCRSSIWGNHQGGFAPPLPGQYVCGTIEHGEKGPCFDEWFICSDQFFHFWKFLMSNNPKPNVTELIRLVDTDRYSLEELTNVEQRKNRLEREKRWVRCWDYHRPGPYADWIRYACLNTKSKNLSKFNWICGHYPFLP